MKKIVLLILLVCFLAGDYCWADGYRGSLMVSSDSVQGSFNMIKDMTGGFWNTGVSALYNEQDGREYKWADIGVTVGGNIFVPGLSGEVGMRGLIGTVEDGGFSGNTGALAFTGGVSYDFAQQMTVPGSFKMFGSIDYANDILSFQDAEKYVAFNLGLGFPIFEHAQIVTVYSFYKMDMTSEPGTWTFDDSAFRAGLELQF